LCLWGAVLIPAAGAEAAVGTVSGTVEPLAWAPEVEVCLVEGRPSETCTAPGADGSYSLEVPLGEVQVEFVPSIRSGLLVQYYDHQSFLQEAAKIKLTQQSPEAKGIDADLIEGGAITGTVSAAAGGSPLAEVEVCAISAGTAPIRRCEETGASGAYEVRGLPGATYRVSFRGRGASAGYQASYYAGKPTLAQATPVQVSARTTKSGIDAALEVGAAIEGHVSEAGGGSLAGIAVCLFEATVGAAERCTYSDEGGGYAFVGLPGGSYEVGFSLEPGEIGGEGASGEGDDFESQYFDRAPSRGQAASISALPPATVSGVDADLSRPPAPPAPAPPLAVSTPILAAAAFVPEPAPPAKRCKKGFHKRKVKGKTRCVKVRKAARRHHRQKQAHHAKGKER
jgi:hypothetical protein